MENQTTNTVPQMPMGNTPMPTMSSEKSSMSGIVGTIIIIALIILGGLYFWGKRINTQKEFADVAQQEQVAAEEASTIESSVSASDDTTSLEAELNATVTSDLGSEL